MIKKLAPIVAVLLLMAGLFIVMSSRTRSGPCTMLRSLTISEVTSGKFVASPPASTEMKDTTRATLLPVGGFYKDTGSRWILVVKDSLHVGKRYISLGRKNSDYIEVLSGLKPGEKVITSSYERSTGFDFHQPVTIEDLRSLNH